MTTARAVTTELKTNTFPSHLVICKRYFCRQVEPVVLWWHRRLPWQFPLFQLLSSAGQILFPHPLSSLLKLCTISLFRHLHHLPLSLLFTDQRSLTFLLALLLKFLHLTLPPAMNQKKRNLLRYSLSHYPLVSFYLAN